MGCTSSSNLDNKNNKSPCGSSNNSNDFKMAGKHTLGVSNQFPALNSQQRLGGSPSKSRNKVALKPGRSLMDWIRLGNSGKDLTGVGRKVIEVTPEELAKHSTADDAWIALRGKVYNISPYLEYHPGGEEELMKGAGIDGTQLFDEVHKWVNYESMLEKCFVGKLKTTPVQKRGSLSSILRLKPSAPNGPAVVQPPPPMGPPPPPGSSPPRFDWYQNDTTVTLVVYTKWKEMRKENIIIDRNGRELTACVYIEDHTFTIHIDLEDDITEDYEVKVQNQTGKTELVLHKQTTGQQWRGVGKFLDRHDAFTPTNDKGPVYRCCRVESVVSVNHDTKLLCVSFPHGTCMCVPVGYHVHIRHKVEDVEVVRSYTLVQPSLGSKTTDQRLSQGKVFYLMIKIYKNGALTPWIDSLTPGDSMEVSQYEGNLSESRLAGQGDLVMYAAGTGFTPMVGLINHCLSQTKPASRKVKLMFFNKTEDDILWREHLDSISSQHEWFSVQYVLSEPGNSWTGPQGRIRLDLMEMFSPHPGGKSDTLICACGPTPFTKTVIQLAKDIGYGDDNLHAFLG
ncbi:cytochrome b5 reductase 4-like isoform X2 [Mizuhopecten yessoensis]|nr:cytochrome b5 reductase 4-like isoform X2 [Mizuhopecten yessoensis]XP_021367381.1 cytochrome b5 reductase 4-like isoform X2 [Mizuhopecten yessoensis]